MANKTQKQLDMEYLEWFLSGAPESAKTPSRKAEDDIFEKAHQKVATAQATLNGISRRITTQQGKRDLNKFENNLKGKIPSYLSNVERLLEEAVLLVDQQNDGSLDGKEAVRTIEEKAQRLLYQYIDLLSWMTKAQEELRKPHRGCGLNIMKQALEGLQG